MGDEQTNTQFRKQKNTQNLNEKSRILKLAFSVHNRHLSESSIKEVINSKPEGDNFDNFKEIVDELEFEIVEHKASKQTDAASLDNTICFFEDNLFNKFFSKLKIRFTPYTIFIVNNAGQTVRWSL